MAVANLRETRFCTTQKYFPLINPDPFKLVMARACFYIDFAKIKHGSILHTEANETVFARFMKLFDK